MDHEGSTFLCGSAPFFDLIFFAKVLDELSEQDIENSSFFEMDGDNWGKYDSAMAWAAVGMATVKRSDSARLVVAVGARGAYWEALHSDPVSEVHGHITNAKNSLRALAVIGEQIYACGMGRTVLRRNRPGDWDEIGPGTSADDGNSVIGLEGLAGFSAEDMYAVGWGGEIWHFANDTWRRLDSPVSANLNAVCCAADGNVYVVGDGGIMLRGHDDVWEVLDTDRTHNLMDVAFYDNTVYVSTDFQILKLDNDTLVQEDAFTDIDDVPETCLHLLAAEDGLVSMGTKDLFRFHSGIWERLL
jgi:hypothetical protein